MQAGKALLNSVRCLQTVTITGYGFCLAALMVAGDGGGRAAYCWCWPVRPGAGRWAGRGREGRYGGGGGACAYIRCFVAAAACRSPADAGGAGGSSELEPALGQ